MSTVKKIFDLLILFILLMILFFHEPILSMFKSSVAEYKRKDITLKRNEYSLQNDFLAFNITDDFDAKDFNHLLNIFYTILDSGDDEFTFYCDKSYPSCIDDVNNIIPKENNNIDYLSEINNFVHPFNSYQYITITTNGYGEINVKIKKQYSNDEIEYINNEITTIIEQNLNNNMDTSEKIRVFHDYIVNNTKYDVNKKNSDITSRNAYGLLKNHIALCGGYSDILSIFLNRLNIKNIRLASLNHVWNYVYLNDNWYNIDMTWDDPITPDGRQLLLHDYFLISNDDLLKLDTNEHIINKNIYLEAK